MRDPFEDWRFQMIPIMACIFNEKKVFVFGTERDFTAFKAAFSTSLIVSLRGIFDIFILYRKITQIVLIRQFQFLAFLLKFV